MDYNTFMRLVTKAKNEYVLANRDLYRHGLLRIMINPVTLTLLKDEASGLYVYTPNHHFTHISGMKVEERTEIKENQFIITEVPWNER